MPSNPDPFAPTVIVGHPFAPIGMGEHLRSTFRAMRAAQLPVKILDVYGAPNPDPRLREELEPFLTDSIGGATSVFCINGDEVEPILLQLGDRCDGRRRIIYPAWELPKYPAEWARQLERFDEVWAASAFTEASLRSSVSIPVHHLPLATQPRYSHPLARRSFGIPEDGYAFLTFFDFRSYIERKNPYAAIEAFRRVLDERPDLNVCLVIKTNGSETRPEQSRAFQDLIEPFADRIVLLNRTMSDTEVKALHVCCDAFVSMHRCEGYGFGLSEAMYFGKPTIATSYSGNMDFMTRETAHLLDFELVPVPEGAYPHGAGQVWADPNLDQAVMAMIFLAEDPEGGRALGAAASQHIRIHFSYRASGLRYAKKLLSST